jgi:hypothetical protein
MSEPVLHLNHSPLRVSDTRFIQECIAQRLDALKIVDSHTDDGENASFRMSECYPHGTQDLLFMLLMKTQRALGYDSSGNVGKVREELQDIFNYSIFALAYLALTQELEKKA